MNYQSKNPVVRHLLDRPRWLEWMEHEVRLINQGLGNPHEAIGDFVQEFVMTDPSGPVYLEGYVQRYSSRPPGFHEVAELVEVMAKYLPVKYHRYLHRGLTSSNVIDSCSHQRWNELAYQMMTSYRLMTDHLSYDETSIKGMTHGRLAHYTSLRHRSRTAVVGDLTWDFINEMVDGGPTGNGTLHRQCYQRYMYWPLWTWMAQIAAACDQIATDYRFYCSDFSPVVGVHGRMGSPTTSSAMPGKANPSEFERICSVSHLVRSMVASQLTLPAQWLDRDLVHSAHERETIDRMWDHTFWMVEGLQRLIIDTILLPDYREIGMTSHDVLNLKLEEGMSYDEARKRAAEFPT